MAWAAVRTKMVVLLLLVHCLLLPPVFVVFCVWSLFCYAVFNVELDAGEDRAGYFTSTLYSIGYFRS